MNHPNDPPRPGPPPMVLRPAGDELQVEQRACLLRAARRELRALQAEHHRLESLPARVSAGPLAVCQKELECISLAVAWLWRQTTP